MYSTSSGGGTPGGGALYLYGDWSSTTQPPPPGARQPAARPAHDHRRVEGGGGGGHQPKLGCLKGKSTTTTRAYCSSQLLLALPLLLFRLSLSEELALLVTNGGRGGEY